MADAGKPFYRAEHRFQLIGGDETEFLVQGFEFEDLLDVGYVLRVRCQIPAAIQEGVAQACAARRMKDAELFVRRRFPDGELLETRICGVIESVERSVSGEPGMGPARDDFVVTLVSAWKLLEHQRTGGTWHNQSYADIVYEQLDRGLAPFGRVVRRDLARDYPLIDFIVRRPDESLFNFCRKLMRRIGVSFYFDHEAGVEVMVLVDTNEAFPKGRRRGARAFTPQWFGPDPSDDEERILKIGKVSRTRPKGKNYRNFDIHMPPTPVEDLADFGAFSGLAGGGSSATDLEGHVVVHEGIRPNELDPVKHVKDRARLEEEVVVNQVGEVQVTSNFSGALAGRRFEVEINPGDIRETVITKVSASGLDFGVPPQDYENEVTFVPVVDESGQAVQIRPIEEIDEGRHTGMFRAELIAIENDPVDVDGLMRCRLKFPWDEQEDELKTTYVSVLQPMAGTHGGTQWIPRAGDRVLVSFVGAHHEQPIIVGSLYDNELEPPQMGPEGLVLPESSSWLGFTHSSIGDKARQTMMNMKLDAGSELMFFNAPWDWDQRIGNDCRVQIEHDETRTIGNDYDESVGAQRKERVGGEYSREVSGDTTITHRGRTTRTLEGPLSITAKSGIMAKVDAGASERVLSGNRSFVVSSGDFVATAARTIRFTAPRLSLNVASMGTGGAGPASGGSLEITRKALLEAPLSTTLKGGQGKVEADEKGVNLTGPATEIKDRLGGSAKLGDGKFVVDAPQGIEFRCGANTLRLAPDGIYVNGTQLHLEAPRTELRTMAFDIVGTPLDGGEST